MMINLPPIALPLAVLSLVVTVLATNPVAGTAAMPKVMRGSISDCASASAIIGCGGPSYGGAGIRFKSAN